MIINLALVPVHDSQSDGLWQATSWDLQRNSVQRHIEHSSATIQHYIFLTGEDDGGAVGIAYLGTTCLQAPSGKKYWKKIIYFISK